MIKLIERLIETAS